MQKASDVITCVTVVGTSEGTISADNKIELMGTGTKLIVIKLDAKTLDCTGYVDPYRLSGDTIPGEYEAAYREAAEMYAGIPTVCGLVMSRDLQNGKAKYIKPTYEQTLAEVTASLNIVTQTVETDNCTVILGAHGGVPHGPYSFIYLVYKAGSELEEGQLVRLPMPGINGWGRTTDPDTFAVSDDGLTLSYSYYFPEQLVIYPDAVIHEAATYSYKTDLTAGTTALEIIPDKPAA